MEAKISDPAAINIPKDQELGPKSSALIVDSNGLIFVSGHDTIYTIDAHYRLTRYAGSGELKKGRKNGPRLEALFDDIMALCWQSPGIMLVACYGEKKIRMIESDIVSDLVGAGRNIALDGNFEEASFIAPIGIACLVADELVAVTELNDAIRLINLKMKKVTTIKLQNPSKLGISSTRFWAISPSINPGKCILGSSNALIELDVSNGEAKTIAGSSPKIFDVRAVTQTADGRVLFCNTEKNSICEIMSDGALQVIPLTETDPPVKLPTSLVVAPNGDLWWTEYSGIVKYAKGTNFKPHITWYSSKKEQQFCSDFSPFFEDFSESKMANPFVDLNVIHMASGHSMSFSKSFFNTIHLNPEIVAKVCSATSMSFENLQICLRLMCGSDLPNVRSHPEVWMNAIYLYSELGLDKIATWLESTFCIQNLKLALPDTLDAYKKIALSIDSKRAPCLKSIEYYMAHALGLQSDQKPIADCFIVGPDPRTQPNPWQYIQNCVEALYKGDNLIIPDFTIATTEGRGVLCKTLRVHKWLLYSRWIYFKLMIDSGFSENSSGIAELPSDFPSELLPVLLEYLYCGTLPDPLNGHQTKSISQYVIENASQYYWTNMDDEPHPSFKDWLSFHQSILKSL